MTGDGLNPHECFGRSVALGDVNGDGRKDLLVASGPCLNTQTDPGRMSVYAGEARDFSTTPVTTTMTWVNPSPRTSGFRMTVSTGDIDGDAYADVLVISFYGVSVFKGGPPRARRDPAAGALDARTLESAACTREGALRERGSALVAVHRLPEAAAR